MKPVRIESFKPAETEKVTVGTEFEGTPHISKNAFAFKATVYVPGANDGLKTKTTVSETLL